MRSLPAKITSKGQITIPREVRKYLGLHSGDRVLFQLLEGQTPPEAVTMASADEGKLSARVSKVPDLLALAGSLASGHHRTGHGWSEIRDGAWDEEIRDRK